MDAMKKFMGSEASLKVADLEENTISIDHSGRTGSTSLSTGSSTSLSRITGEVVKGTRKAVAGVATEVVAGTGKAVVAGTSSLGSAAVASASSLAKNTGTLLVEQANKARALTNGKASSGSGVAKSMSKSCSSGQATLLGQSPPLSGRRQTQRQATKAKELSLRGTNYHARESEQQVIAELFQKSRQQGQYLTIKGRAGVGKTSLVEVALQAEEKRGGCFFVEGKFEQIFDGKSQSLESNPAEQNSIRRPFSAIVDAMADLIGKWASTEEGTSQIREFCEKHSEDKDILQNFLPFIYEIYQDLEVPDREDPGSAVAPAIGSAHVQERVKIVIYKILRCITDTSKPVVMILDDLQRSDQPSLDVLKFLVREDLPGLFVIGTFRSDEVNEGHQLSDHLRMLREDEGLAERLHDIHLVGFTVDELNELLSKVTRKDKEEILPLVQVIHEKTGGNPFFIEHCLHLLQGKGHLTFSFMKCQWEWEDVGEIRKAMSIVSTDVADMVIASMRKLDGETQRILQVLSCLGTQIPFGVIKEYWECTMEESKRDHEVMAIETILESLIEENILKHSSGSHMYTWAHDKLQQAAYSMLTEGERYKLHLRLGRLLFEMTKKDASKRREVLVYVASCQWNQVPMTLWWKEGDKRVFDLVSLNVRAAQFLVAKAAFHPAVDLLRGGISILKSKADGAEGLDYSAQDAGELLLDYKIPSHHWTRTNHSSYKLCLDLFNTLMETYFAIGNYESSEAVAEEVLRNASSIEDKIRARSCLIDCKSNGKHRDYDQGVAMHRDALNDYGIDFPAKPSAWQLSCEKRRMKKALPNGKLEGLLHLPSTEDAKALAISRHLAWMAQDACLVNTDASIKLAKYASMRAFRHACNHGINTYITLAVTYYAYTYRTKGAFGKSFQYANLASEFYLHASASMHAGKESSRIIAVLHSSMISLKKPLQDSLEPFMEGYRSGIRTGGIECAFINAMSYGYNYLFCGLPLDPLMLDLKAMSKEASQFSLAPPIRVQFPILLQTAMNLQGSLSNPTLLRGKATKQKDLLEDFEGKARSMTFRDVCIFRLLLAYVYRDLSTAKELLDSLDQHQGFNPAISRNHLRIAFSGLAAFALLRSTKERKYKKISSNAVAYFTDAVQQGSLNAYPILSLLLAEKSPSKKNYDQAVRVCGRSGLLNFQAIANENAGLFFAAEGDHGMSILYLEEARTKYKEWGATGKSRRMDAALAHSSASTASTASGGSYHGKRKFRDRCSVVMNTKQIDLSEFSDKELVVSDDMERSVRIK